MKGCRLQGVAQVVEQLLLSCTWQLTLSCPHGHAGRACRAGRVGCYISWRLS
jgi:hypothetical protein